PIRSISATITSPSSRTATTRWALSPSPFLRHVSTSTAPLLLSSSTTSRIPGAGWCPYAALRPLSGRDTFRRRAVFGKKVLPASVWVQVEAAAMEVDRGLEVLAVAEAAGSVPDPLDLRVQALGGGVGDPVAKVG